MIIWLLFLFGGLIGFGGAMQSKFVQQIGESINNEVLVSDEIKSYKKRESIYLWVVTCTEDECKKNVWKERFNWQQYTVHYKNTHKGAVWANGKSANKCDQIMDHIKVVGRWKAVNTNGPKTHYKEYRFVETLTLSLIQNGDVEDINDDIDDLEVNNNNNNDHGVNNNISNMNVDGINNNNNIRSQSVLGVRQRNEFESDGAAVSVRPSSAQRRRLNGTEICIEAPPIPQMVTMEGMMQFMQSLGGSLLQNQSHINQQLMCTERPIVQSATEKDLFFSESYERIETAATYIELCDDNKVFEMIEIDDDAFDYMVRCIVCYGWYEYFGKRIPTFCCLADGIKMTENQANDPGFFGRYKKRNLKEHIVSASKHGPGEELLFNHCISLPKVIAVKGEIAYTVALRGDVDILFEDITYTQHRIQKILQENINGDIDTSQVVGHYNHSFMSMDMWRDYFFEYVTENLKRVLLMCQYSLWDHRR